MQTEKKVSKQNKTQFPYWSLLGVALVYMVVVVLSLDHCYFWDNIQQTSKEAHWFYRTNFESLMLPGFTSGSDIVGTGYHPPLMGIMTALLWKVFGIKLWVSHLFVGLWALWLAYVSHRLVSHIVPGHLSGWLLLVLLLEPTVVAQLAMASPDIVLLASFVGALLAVVEGRRLLLGVMLLFLGLVNGRGMFAAAFVFLFDLAIVYWYRNEKLDIRTISRLAVSHLALWVLLATYFTVYFIENGWFLGESNTQWGEGWKSPEGWYGYTKNLAAFGLRLMENGRIALYALLLFLLWKTVRLRQWKGDGLDKSMALLFLLFGALYFYFAMTTRISIAARYYMPMFFVLTLWVARMGSQWANKVQLRRGAMVVLLFWATGHFWIYPDKVAKAWDATLAHWHYYALRDECYGYLQEQGIGSEVLGGGFCLDGNQKYVDLRKTDFIVEDDTTRRYFLYSNISNIEDETMEALQDQTRWKRIKEFRRGFVKIQILEKQY